VGSGPIEFITDVNWAEDIIKTVNPVSFAANVGVGTGADLNAAANGAIAAAHLLNASKTESVAAQFTFGGRIYLAINQDMVFNAFDGTRDMLLDITGVVGTIGPSNFDQ
jgi:hypothetical protein